MGRANLCRGPELNWRHMVLQPFVPRVVAFRAALVSHEQWFGPMPFGSLVRPTSQRTASRSDEHSGRQIHGREEKVRPKTGPRVRIGPRDSECAEPERLAGWPEPELGPRALKPRKCGPVGSPHEKHEYTHAKSGHFEIVLEVMGWSLSCPPEDAFQGCWISLELCHRDLA